MALVIRHNFVSPVVDQNDPNEVGPNEWNDDHAIIGVVDASEVTFTPAGNIASTDVQAAIAELDNEKLPNSGGTMSSYIDFTEIADPANPSANNARLFARDNGSGKTQICIKFPTGSTIVIATED